MRAESIKEPQFPITIASKVWQFVEAEIFARITAIFTSIFAVADSFTHLLSGFYKGAYLLLERCCLVSASWNRAEVYEHFKLAAFFSVVALVGSVVGIIIPGLCKHFKRSPSISHFHHELPKKVSDLASAILSGREQAPFHQVQTVWQQSDLSTKDCIVQACNQDREEFQREEFQTVRKALANVIYRPIHSILSPARQVQWLNETEIRDRVSHRWERTDTFSKGFFFHATSKESLESVLKAEKIEVRHEKLYRGAFVSTQPELGFGRCVIVLKRNIERLSTLEHGFTVDQNTYWAGFSRDIPVAESTLAYIILNSHSIEERASLEMRCEKWAKRKIEVILLPDVEQKLQQVQRLGLGIPNEWPAEGEEIASMILQSLQIAAPQEVLLRRPRQLLMHA